MATASLPGGAMWPLPTITTAEARAGRLRLPAPSPNGYFIATLVLTAQTRSRREAEEMLKEVRRLQARSSTRRRTSTARGVGVLDMMFVPNSA